MPELSLDDQQRDLLAGHLYGVGGPELMRSKAATDANGLGGVMQLATDPSWGAWPTARGAAQDAEQRADGA